MKLSVIIPCLNGAATLATQLEALSAQTWSEPWELILSDNGSTDDSIDIASHYGDRFHAFKIVDASAHRGGAFAVNMGAKAASSDRFAVCDADDEVAPGWLAAMGDALSQYDVVCGQMKFDKFNEPIIASRSAQAWKDGLYKGRYLPGGGSGNYGIQRWIHEAIGGFDECLPHAYDADYFWRLQLKGFKLHHVPDAVIQIRLGRVNSSFSSIYNRGKNRAASNHWLYKRYRNLGMQPPPPLRKTLAVWFRVLRNGMRPGMRKKEQRAKWLQNFAKQTGSLMGELKGRITNPCKPYS